MRRGMTRFAAFFSLSLLATACVVDDASVADDTTTSDDGTGDGAGGKADGPGPSPDGVSHVADAVIEALDATAPGEYGRTWTVSHSNQLTAGWLVQSPPAAHWGRPLSALQLPAQCTSGAGCDLDFGLRTCSVDADCGATGKCEALASTVKAPGQAARKLCTGHSDVTLLDELYRLITSAQRAVDITSLQPPDGRFLAAMRNALTYLARAGRTVDVRLLVGTFPVQGEVDSEEVLRALTRDLPSSSTLKVSAGHYRSSNLPPSWNHSKIVAIDGKTALVGGHNLWSQHYLDKEPVHDLSMRVTGPAARDAHRFADVQWRWTCANKSWMTWLTGSVWANTWRSGRIDSKCPGDIALPAATAGAGAATVIGAGRLAWVDAQDDANQGDLALVAMMEAATSSIRISQQDIGPVKLPVIGIPYGDWPEESLDAMAAAILRGVRVEIVVSSPEASVGGLGPSQAPYANGWSLDDVAQQIRERVTQQPGAPSGATLDTMLCQRLFVGPVRASADDTWPTGGAPGNHAKLVFVDDVTFYIGSQNVYPAGLTEYGYIVDDAGAAAGLRAQYWDPMWQWSRARAVSGARCVN